MTIYKLPEMTVVPLPDRPLAVALGDFDGVHRGHRELLSQACALAARIPDCASAVWTFTALTKGRCGVPSLTDAAEKLRQFALAGIEYAVLAEFDAVRDLSPESFACSYLADKLHCAAVVCGFNFRFGKGGAGDADVLRGCLASRGIPLTVVAPVLYGGDVVSSTRIRLAVETGDMETAATLLGRPFSVCLPVLHGNRIGRTLGLPTINQRFPEGQIVPCGGIYACVCTLDGRRYPAVTNVGTRPTVSDSGEINCETHVLDYEGDLYGETVCVEFCHRLRAEQKFASVSLLKEAIEGDAANARAYFAADGKEFLANTKTEDVL